MGLTNRVQPYCRFAIIAMQTMPMTSCSHRYEAGLVILLSASAVASVCINSSFFVPLCSDVPGEPRSSAPLAAAGLAKPPFVVTTYRLVRLGRHTARRTPLVLVEVFYGWHKLLLIGAPT